MFDYSTNFAVRSNMIWCALSSYRVKDPFKYRRSKEKIWGPILLEAVKIAKPFMETECLAVCESKVDEILSATYGWKTREEWRNEI